MMPPPGLVIFDCDGVLVETERLANQRLAAWLTEAGFATDYTTCRRRFVGRSMVSVQAEVESTGVSLGSDFVDRWNAGLPLLFAEGVEQIPHVADVIDLLGRRRVAYCVASSGRVSKMQLTLGVSGLLPLFADRMFSATMVERGKPFPDLFLHAAGAMGFRPEQCAVIEDSVAGVKAGVAAGMRVFAYCGDPDAEREALKEAGAVPFDDMRDLARLLHLT